tara:strand:- start:390 stop:833 length:444 start_codon:yes stop_codon:yes gene_type:complete
MRKPLPSQETLHHLFYTVGGKLLNKVRRGQRGHIGADASGIGSNGRHRVKINGDWFLTARLMWMYYHNIEPGELDVEHIDENKLNDNIWNLQLMPNRENIQKHWQLKPTEGNSLSWYYRRGLPIPDEARKVKNDNQNRIRQNRQKDE